MMAIASSARYTRIRLSDCHGSAGLAMTPKNTSSRAGRAWCSWIASPLARDDGLIQTFQ